MASCKTRGIDVTLVAYWTTILMLCCLPFITLDTHIVLLWSVHHERLWGSYRVFLVRGARLQENMAAGRDERRETPYSRGKYHTKVLPYILQVVRAQLQDVLRSGPIMTSSRRRVRKSTKGMSSSVMWRSLADESTYNSRLQGLTSSPARPRLDGAHHGYQQPQTGGRPSRYVESLKGSGPANAHNNLATFPPALPQACGVSAGMITV
jgi:hypothetical protein